MSSENIHYDDLQQSVTIFIFYEIVKRFTSW